MGAVGVMQLSEPLLWFILRVLDKESALAEFNRMGGVKVCSIRIETVCECISFEQNCLSTWGLTDITETHETVKQYKAN